MKQKESGLNKIVRYRKEGGEGEEAQISAMHDVNNGKADSLSLCGGGKFLKGNAARAGKL